MKKKKKNKSKTKDRIKNKKFKDLNISLLEEYHRDGKKLLPPLSKSPTPMSKLSWYNDALNEILWAAILRGNMERQCPPFLRHSLPLQIDEIPA